MKNLQIRNAAKNAGVRLWQIAIKLGVSEATITRWLRRELPDAERDKLLVIIDEIASEKAAEEE